MNRRRCRRTDRHDCTLGAHTVSLWAAAQDADRATPAQGWVIGLLVLLLFIVAAMGDGPV